ncbi:MAG: alcohol dehydrogenase, partial [Eggerthellaceae bacterium]|nr:alcohol dehydrogenase [Eggerthellaceae bacterium]
KKATTLMLDTADLWRYQDGVIVKNGGYRFGVFSVAEGDYSYKVSKMVAYFDRYGVDFIVALVPDMALVQDVKGIDIVISTKDEGLFVMGETRNGTFYVSTPAVGSVGAILIAPSKVVSAKVISG